MVNVQQRVGANENREIIVAGALIQLVELLGSAGTDNKAIGGDTGLLFGREQHRQGDIAQIGSNRLDRKVGLLSNRAGLEAGKAGVGNGLKANGHSDDGQLERLGTQTRVSGW